MGQSGGHANGHNIAASKTQVPVNQAPQSQNKVAAKSQVNKNRRESPLTKSKEVATVNSRDVQSPLSASKECQTPTQSNSRPKRSGRSFIDRNPDFHTDISLRGEASETDSVDGVPPISSTQAKRPKKQIAPHSRNEESATESFNLDPSSTVTSVPSLSEPRPKRSTGRSLFERNPDFAMDIPYTKIVEQKVSEKENVVAHDSDKNKKVINENKYNENVNVIDVDSGVLEVVIEPWKSEEYRAEHLAKLDHALSSAGWSQAIRSGKNMEKEVFKNSSTEAEYVAGITRLVAHFNRGNSGVKPFVNIESSRENRTVKQISGNFKKESGHQEQIGSKKTIKSGSEKSKTEVSNLVSQKAISVLRERRAVKPTKKIREKNTKFENSKVMKKVTKTWSKTKVNCPMCGQLKLKTKMKEHILVFHKSSQEPPSNVCAFKSTAKTELGNHLKTDQDDLNPDGSVSESEGSVTSQSTSSASDARGRANSVRSQFQYIVKTSKSGKQGRKYIQVGSEGGSETEVPELTTSELKSEIVENQAPKKTPKAKRVLTPGSKLVKSSEDVSVSHNGVLQYLKEDEKSRVHEVVHEASVSEKVIDEFAGSSSESEFSEPRSQIVGTLNAYYMNKNCPDEDDVSCLKIDSVASVTPVKSTIDVKDTIVDDVKHEDSINDQENVNNTTRKENMIPINERPQRRKRSIEDIHPDFVMDMPRSGQKGDRHVKKGKQEIEEIEVSSVAKNWFEVNQGDEF